VVIEDFERCYRAVQSRDPRFDGWFFTAVSSTGIYCRPSCPAKTPMRRNVHFYTTAAAAQHAGYRACKRCRPNAVPGSPEWDSRADVVARAMRLIGDGVIDRDGVPGLAERLGYSTRQLQRLLLAEVGAGPLAIARAQRAQTARVLIESTPLSMADVAIAAGFASIRQFNDTIRAVFDLSPSTLRARAALPAPPMRGTPVVLRLPYRRPFSPDNLFGHLAATAVPGVEEVVGSTYRRTLRLPHGHGIVALTPAADHVLCRARLTDLRDLTTAIARCRWLLDLDADPVAVDGLLAEDPLLRKLVEWSPGRRVPRCVDPAEMALRAVIGQQVSTAGARTTTARIVSEQGESIEDPEGGLRHLFPAIERFEVPDGGLPASRLRTLARLVEALRTKTIELDPGCDREAVMAELARIPGVGEWTLNVIAMRALGDPDAFVATDLGVRHAAEHLGLPASAPALSERSQRWRPWRAYAVQYLWSALPHAVNDWPPAPKPSKVRPGEGRS
jgi:AraC family transcriptional regulator of adaptative response / DNA-3-methyladenine glycosylase II